MVAVDTDIRAGRREWIGLAVLALPTLLVSLDVGALFLALPHLTVDLHAGSVQQLWITDIYGFMTAGFLITMGTLGDRIGRRRLLLIGAVAFGLVSVLAAYSTSPGMLIASRALLGVAGATLMPSTLALISNMFRSPRERGAAIAVWVTCLMVGAALGPVIGGALLGYFWWGSVFLLGVPVMVVLLVTGPILLPEYRDASAGRLDLASVLLSLAAILPTIYGIKDLAVYGGRHPLVPVAAVLAGVAFGALFVRRQTRLASPLLDLRLFTVRPFRAALIIMVFGGAVMAGVYLLLAQYVQTVGGLSSWRTGLYLAPAALSIAVGAMIAPGLARWIRPGYLIGGGLGVSALGFLLLTQVGHLGGLWVLELALVAYNVGAGPMMALGTNLVVGSAPPERAGSAAALSETSNHFGTAFGLAVLGTIGTAVYRGRLGDTVPSGLPGQVVDTARQNVASAAGAAARLSGSAGTDLLHAARDSFTAALNVVGGIGGAVAVALAVLAVVQFRHLPRTGEQPPAAADPVPAPVPADAQPREAFAGTAD